MFPNHPRFPFGSLVYVCCLWIFAALPAQSQTSDILTLRRVGHRPVQMPAISDGAARAHAYFSVVAFHSGEVVPLNNWYHPQLYTYDPTSSALVSRGFMFPHKGMGNEDDTRWRIRAHKGASASESLVFWHVKGWEEITDENGTFAHDSAVFSTRPWQRDGVMPKATPKVVNVGADSDNVNVGPYRAGIDYDQTNALLFVSTDRSDLSEHHSLFQTLKVDPKTGRFSDRAHARAPGDRYCQEHTFLRVDPAHGVAMTMSENHWQRHRSMLYLVQYSLPPGESVPKFSNAQRLVGEEMALKGSSDKAKREERMPVEALDALYVEKDGHLWVIIAARHGLFTFDLGALGSSYQLSAPVGKVPLYVGAQAIKLVGQTVIVSANGLHAFSLTDILAVRGEKRVPSDSVRLPYKTYEFDRAKIGGRETLFLASGTQGINVFELQKHAPETTAAPSRRVTTLVSYAAEILLETGADFRTFGAPTLNDEHTIAMWAVTKDGEEAIVVIRPDRVPAIIAHTGKGGYRTLSKPSVASRDRVVFLASTKEGGQRILSWDAGTLRELARTSDKVRALGVPEISNTGAVVYSVLDAQGKRSILVQDAGGRTTTIFENNEVWEVPDNKDSPPSQYDISPKGHVAFVMTKVKSDHHALSLWNGSELVDLITDDREVNYPRYTASALPIVRTWGDEVIKLRGARLSNDAPEIVTFADRHSSYQKYIFGNFSGGAAIDPDNVVFLAQKYAPNELEPSELGNSLHLFSKDDESLPGTLLATGDSFAGGIVRNILFVDGVTRSGSLTFVVELERSSGISYLLVVAKKSQG